MSTWNAQQIKAIMLDTSSPEAATRGVNWLGRGLLAIFANQTADEQYDGQVKTTNGVGFNKVDSGILSGIAVGYQHFHNFTPRQIVLLRRKMPKYAGQLARIANAKAQ